MTIVKTRQQAGAAIGKLEAPKSRGVLRLPPEGVEVLRLTPAPALIPFIAYYWKVSWDLRDRAPHLQETLPHPNVYLIFEENRLQLSGVTTSKFTRLLRGQSFAFGVKFRPGGFRPFLNASVSSLTDRVTSAVRIFGPDAEILEAELQKCTGIEAMTHLVNQFFLLRVPPRDDNVERVDRIVSQILQHPHIHTLDDLAHHTGIGKRSLQRLFREYVGATPKWVIRRFRLHDLIERMEACEPLNWADLALELGYYDQAHLIHDFRTITGYSPAHYQRG